MGKQKLDSRTRESIKKYIDSQSNIELKRIAEMIEPHLNYDYDGLEKMYAYSVARGLIASLRGEDGTRRYFAVKRKNGTVYVDVDNCQDIELLEDVNNEMEIKLKGISKSHSKIKKKHDALKGQISIQDYVQEIHKAE